MMHDQRIGALLWNEHVVLAQRDIDLLGLEQQRDQSSILKIWTRGIYEAVATAAITLLKQLANVRRVFRSKPKFLPHPLVPHLSKRLSGFNAEAVQIQIVLV